MNPIVRHIMRTLPALAILTLSVGCTSDDSHDADRHLHLVMGGRQYADVGTRALPDGFLPYGTGTGMFYEGGTLPAKGRLQGYIAQTGSGVPTIGQFAFTDVAGNRTWNSRLQIDDDGTYYFYGVMPKEDVEDVSIAPYNSDYATGAVITLTNLDAITAADVCVVVGVRKHDNATDDITSLDMAGRLGQFDLNIDEGENYAYLLVEHLFCGMQFQMKVDAGYNALRTIKVRSVKLLPAVGTEPVKTVNATVTLVAGKQDSNGVPLSPLSAAAGGSVVITTNQSGEMSNPVYLFNYTDEDHLLELSDAVTAATTFSGYYAPATERSLIFETTYDVYDRYGHLVRQNQTARNTFRPKEMRPGEQYTYVITVNPTYIYQLSEYDLDSPVFNME